MSVKWSISTMFTWLLNCSPNDTLWESSDIKWLSYLLQNKSVNVKNNRRFLLIFPTLMKNTLRGHSTNFTCQNTIYSSFVGMEFDECDRLSGREGLKYLKCSQDELWEMFLKHYSYRGKKIRLCWPLLHQFWPFLVQPLYLWKCNTELQEES